MCCVLTVWDKLSVGLKMGNWLKKIMTWFSEPAGPVVRFIFIDVGYHSYSLAAALKERDDCELVAFIDEEPWNHLTELLAVKLYYPSELVALCEKHQVHRVIGFDGMGWSIDEQTQRRLKNLKVNVITLPSTTASAQALAIVSG
ncbi:nucleoside-diphosphate sugar epimerase/dehydratase [Amphritea japonica]|uniref:Uncharacterized protein n=2 Tax=Amphritea TaxID=515417 RepID=A0A7R6P4E9_9GAMM|nr:hypothetical protein [Amphritea japonica]BBB25779.1 conserved hypothetical protein [Amphritea japonica ATCC BAA-1530]